MGSEKLLFGGEVRRTFGAKRGPVLGFRVMVAKSSSSSTQDNALISSFPRRSMIVRIPACSVKYFKSFSVAL